MKTAYQIEKLEVLRVSGDVLADLSSQAYDSAEKKGKRFRGLFTDVYPGLKTMRPDTMDLSPEFFVFGDQQQLRTLKYDLEYNYTPRTVALQERDTDPMGFQAVGVAYPVNSAPAPAATNYPTKAAYPANKYIGSGSAPATTAPVAPIPPYKWNTP